MQVEGLAERLRDRYPDITLAWGEATITVTREELVPALRFLREAESLAFDFLSDVSCTDWPNRVPRIWMAYHLRSTQHRHRLRVKVGLLEENLRIDSVTGLFATADFQEREIFDLFGVTFSGHPDLRRIFLPEEWVGHPLRKDEPLGGVATQYKGAFVPPPDERGL